MSRPRKDRLGASRRALVDWIGATEWGVNPMTDDEISETASGLGVTEELLLEARAEATLDGRARNPMSTLSKISHRLRVGMPDMIWGEWQARAKRQRMTTCALLRSLIHAYLTQDAWEPSAISDEWWYRGLQREITYRGQRNPTSVARSWISVGALEALRLRGQRHKTDVTTMARALIIALLESRVPFPVLPVKLTDMPLTPQRYRTLAQKHGA